MRFIAHIASLAMIQYNDYRSVREAVFNSLKPSDAYMRQ